jgi:hypothetical protein
MCVCYCQNDKVNSIFGGGWIGYEDLIKWRITQIQITKII